MWFRRAKNALEHDPFMKYVYGVIETHKDKTFQTKSVVGGIGAIDTAHTGGLGLLVSGIDAPKIRPSRKNMLSHTRVLEDVMQSEDVLPMRFGMVIDDQDHAVRLLTEFRDVFLEGLEKIKGAVEIGLRAEWDQDSLMKEILTEEADIAELRGEIAGRSEQETYYERIELGRKIEAAIRARNDALEARVHPKLSELTRGSTLSERKDEMKAIDAAYLVPRTDYDSFTGVAESLFDDLSDMMSVKLVGPVPPYNFVDIRITDEFGSSANE